MLPTARSEREKPKLTEEAEYEDSNNRSDADHQPNDRAGFAGRLCIAGLTQSAGPWREACLF